MRHKTAGVENARLQNVAKNAGRENAGLENTKGKYLLITHRLTNKCAKIYCNRTLIVQVILQNAVTCF